VLGDSPLSYTFLTSQILTYCWAGLLVIQSRSIPSINDRIRDHPLDLWVSGIAYRRDLLHARRRSAGPWPEEPLPDCRRWVRSLSVRNWVGGRYHLSRPRTSCLCFMQALDNAYADLPCDLAAGPKVWMARPRSVHLYRGDHRPPRDYMYAATFPKWMVFAAPGVTPILADAAAYVGIVIVGHAVMRLFAGPSGKDSLTRGPHNPVR
jgi:hypothetical protein